MELEVYNINLYDARNSLELEQIDLINEVLGYIEIREYITDKQKLNCSNWLNKAFDYSKGFKFVPIFKNLMELREDLELLYMNYYYNQNKYIKICSTIFKLLENGFLNNFGLTGSYFLNKENINDTKELLKLIHCSSKYNEYLYKYESKIREKNGL